MGLRRRSYRQGGQRETSLRKSTFLAETQSSVCGLWQAQSRFMLRGFLELLYRKLCVMIKLFVSRYSWMEVFFFFLSRGMFMPWGNLVMALISFIGLPLKPTPPQLHIILHCSSSFHPIKRFRSLSSSFSFPI